MTKKILEKIIKSKLAIEKKNEILKIFLYFKDLIKQRYPDNVVLFLNLCNAFLKKILRSKKIVSMEVITKKLYSADVYDKISDNNYTGFVNWLFK
jgi:hypothetical protein